MTRTRMLGLPMPGGVDSSLADLLSASMINGFRGLADTPEKYKPCCNLSNLLYAVTLTQIHRWPGMDGVRTAEGVRELQAR